MEGLTVRMSYALGKSEGLLGLNRTGGRQAMLAFRGFQTPGQEQPSFSSTLAVFISYCADKPD